MTDGEHVPGTDHHPAARAAWRIDAADGAPRESSIIEGVAKPFHLDMAAMYDRLADSLHAHRASRYEPGLLAGRNLPLTDATSLASRS